MSARKKAAVANKAELGSPHTPADNQPPHSSLSSPQAFGSYSVNNSNNQKSLILKPLAGFVQVLEVLESA